MLKLGRRARDVYGWSAAVGYCTGGMCPYLPWSSRLSDMFGSLAQVEDGRWRLIMLTRLVTASSLVAEWDTCGDRDVGKAVCVGLVFLLIGQPSFNCRQR